jgi:hypothetical protein
MAQYDDLDEVEGKIQFKRGLFLTFEDFKKNAPVPEEAIVTSFNPVERNFYYNLLKEDKINITTLDSNYKVKPSKIWGYYDGKGFYLNRKIFPSQLLQNKDVSDHMWAQIVELGKICLIYYNKNFKPELSLWTLGSPSKRNKAALFLMDSRDGLLYKAGANSLDDLIQDDPEIHKAFRMYKGDDEEKLYIFLKQYNRKHKLEVR